MKILLLAILFILGCNVGNSASEDNSDNKINYTDEQKRDCESCAKTSMLSEYGYDKIDCVGRCEIEAPSMIAGCENSCRLENSTMLAQARDTCYLAFQCPQIQNNYETEIAEVEVY